jgi:hypothetical protein
MEHSPRGGIDEQTLEIRAAEFTTSDVGDAPMLPELLDQIPPDQEIASVTADGAFDTRKCHEAIAARSAADAYLRRSVAFSDAYGRASARTVIAPQRFRIALPIEDVLGPDFARSVEGVRRVGDLGSREWTTVDFGNGRVVAVYELSLDGRIRLITLFPDGTCQRL